MQDYFGVYLLSMLLSALFETISVSHMHFLTLPVLFNQGPGQVPAEPATVPLHTHVWPDLLQNTGSVQVPGNLPFWSFV